MSDNNYALSHNDIAQLILTIGREQTIIVEGYLGWGKSAIIDTLNKELPEHYPAMINCVDKMDGGDLMIPMMKKPITENGREFIRFAPNEELGLHLDKPAIMMFDEYAKNRAIMPIFAAAAYERRFGGLPMHEDTIVFGTTNLSTEGLGDNMKAHEGNRFTRVKYAKPTPKEWLAWAFNNNIHTTVMAVADEYHEFFEAFDENGNLENPARNPYIHNPADPARRAVVTGRSLAAASTIMHRADNNPAISRRTLMAALGGTIGFPAALKMLAFIEMYDKLPRLRDVCADPKGSLLPPDGATMSMLVFNALSTLDQMMVAGWTEYMKRLPAEGQQMFTNMVRQEEYSDTKRNMLFSDRNFNQWARDNRHLWVKE